MFRRYEVRVIEDAAQRDKVKWESGAGAGCEYGCEVRMLVERLSNSRGGSVAGTVVRIPANGRFAYLEVRVIED